MCESEFSQRMYCKLTITCYVSKTLFLKNCRIYNIFGSGSTHAAHAQFIVQSAVDNGGRKIGLSRGATTRMGSWFYAQMRMLRLKNTPEATITQKKFRDLALKENEKLAVQDIMDPRMWKAIFTLLRAFYPALRCLRYCDTNTPAMDKLATLAYRTNIALERSIKSLNDEDLFRVDESRCGLTAEENELFALDDRFHDV